MEKQSVAWSLVALLLMALSRGAYADEMLIPNSTSPDGRYALYAVDAHQDSLTATLEIRGLKDQKTRIQIDGGGWVERASAYTYGSEDVDSIFVVWNQTGTRVAMMVRDGKRSGSLLICKRENDSFQQDLKLPDFQTLVEKVFRLKRDGRYEYDFPQTWINPHKLLIKMRFDDLALADSKSYEIECSLEYDIVSGKVSNIKVLSKTVKEG